MRRLHKKSILVQTPRWFLRADVGADSLNQLLVSTPFLSALPTWPLLLEVAESTRLPSLAPLADWDQSPLPEATRSQRRAVRYPRAARVLQEAWASIRQRPNLIRRTNPRLLSRRRRRNPDERGPAYEKRRASSLESFDQSWPSSASMHGSELL